MTEWSPTQYLQFEKQRTQPAIDLAVCCLELADIDG